MDDELADQLSEQVVQLLGAGDFGQRLLGLLQGLPDGSGKFLGVVVRVLGQLLQRCLKLPPVGLQVSTPPVDDSLGRRVGVTVEQPADESVGLRLNRDDLGANAPASSLRGRPGAGLIMLRW